MSNIIAVDCDEVLIESVQNLIDYVNTTHNYQRNYHEIHDYFLSRNPRCEFSDEEAIQLFDDHFSSELAKTSTPVAWAYDKLLSWKSHGYKLVVVTARNTRARDLTYHQLETYFPGLFDEVYLGQLNTPNYRPKSAICKDIGSTLLVEDHLDNALEVAAHDINSILLSKPRNTWREESHNRIHRTTHRNELADNPSIYFY